jgi:tetratricopeptide (TPR) repeat protein
MTGDRWCLAYHLSEQIWSVWDDGETTKARLLFEEQLQTYREFADQQGEVQVLRYLSLMAIFQGNIDGALSYLEECPHFVRDLSEVQMRMIYLQAKCALWQANLPEAQAFFEDAQRMCLEIGSPFMLSSIQEGLGQVKYCQGEYLQAEKHLKEALTIADQARSQVLLDATRRWIWQDLGDVARAQGEIRQATYWYRKSLALMRLMGCKPFMPDTIEGIAKVGMMESHLLEAACLFGASQSARNWMNIPLAPVNRPDYERSLKAVREALGETAFTLAWEEGKVLTLEQAVEMTLTDRFGSTQPGKIFPS